MDENEDRQQAEQRGQPLPYYQQRQQPPVQPLPPPPQPQPPPPDYHQPHQWKLPPIVWVILIVILSAGVYALAASSHNTATQDTSAATTQAAQSTEAPTVDTQATQNAQTTQDILATQNAQATQDAQPTAQPTFPPQSRAFSGNGNQKTTRFAPLRDTCQLSWTCDPVAYGFEYNLIVELYDINGNLVDTPVNVICKTGVTSGSTMEYNASGLYYLEVTSEGPWKVKIQTQ
ncbi:MAG: hypothetical protein E6I80_00670 [Chloroflexi bacterium]|nr:MAG: hypothetical protein E6I80_00670 [Chloroflexota bacterium]